MPRFITFDGDAARLACVFVLCASPWYSQRRIRAYVQRAFAMLMYRVQRLSECLYFLLLGTACSVYDDAQLRAASSPNQPANVAGMEARPSVVAEDPVAPVETVQCAEAGALSSYCAQLPRLLSPPVIDGALECGLPLLAVAPEHWNGSSPVPPVSAAYAAAWADGGFYTYVEVRGRQPLAHPADQPIYCGDAVELYVDGNAASSSGTGAYEAAGTTQFVVAAPGPNAAAIDAWRFVQGNPQGAWIARDLHVKTLEDGYSVEALISAGDLGLWSWSPLSQLGFDLAIDVALAADEPSPRSAGRLGQFFLRVQPTADVCHGEPWCDVRAFCRPQLSSRE